MSMSWEGHRETQLTRFVWSSPVWKGQSPLPARRSWHFCHGWQHVIQEKASPVTVIYNRGAVYSSGHQVHVRIEFNYE